MQAVAKKEATQKRKKWRCSKCKKISTSIKGWILTVIRGKKVQFCSIECHNSY